MALHSRRAKKGQHAGRMVDDEADEQEAETAKHYRDRRRPLGGATERAAGVGKAAGGKPCRSPSTRFPGLHVINNPQALVRGKALGHLGTPPSPRPSHQPNVLLPSSSLPLRPDAALQVPPPPLRFCILLFLACTPACGCRQPSVTRHGRALFQSTTISPAYRLPRLLDLDRAASPAPADLLTLPPNPHSCPPWTAPTQTPSST